MEDWSVVSMGSRGYSLDLGSVDSFRWLSTHLTSKAIYFCFALIFFLQLHGNPWYFISWLDFCIFRDDTTRITGTIPLRESFSLPFLWLQLLLITAYMRPNVTAVQQVHEEYEQTNTMTCYVTCVFSSGKLYYFQRFYVAGLFVSTWLFALFWQFNQFILLLQAMALFAVQVLHIVPHYKVRMPVIPR